MINNPDIMRQLKPLIQQARNEGSWLHCTYQDLWFTPDELERNNQVGKFLWGPVNWTLRDPAINVGILKGRVTAALDDLAAFEQRMAKSGRRH